MRQLATPAAAQAPDSEPTRGAPAVSGAYSATRTVGSFLQVSGQLGTADDAHTIGAQTAVALRRVSTLLEAGGATWADVLTVRVFLASDDLFDEFDAVYSAWVPRPYPARVTVSVGLAPGALVEVDALAIVESAPRPQDGTDTPGGEQ